MWSNNGGLANLASTLSSAAVRPHQNVTNDEKPILCFQHCRSGSYIACFTVPASCPLCGRPVGGSPLKIPPFVMPCPFVNSANSPYCVVIRPTVGSFLRDYTSSSNLHVGITDSLGVVYHFDQSGVQCSLEGWAQCVAVPVLELQDVNRRNTWSVSLTQYCTSGQWLPEVYSEHTNNCFDFVLGFLRLVFLSPEHPDGWSQNSNTETTCSTASLYRHLDSKLEFCEKVVLPQTRRAARYIAIYRRLEREGVVFDLGDRKAADAMSYFAETGSTRL